MNNLQNTSVQVFLDALAKDKSQIKTIDPIVVFRRILGLGDRLDTTSVFSGLQKAAQTVNKTTDFQKKFVKPNFVGEVIVWDIGKDDWCQFKVIREPLKGEGNRIAINFIISVTDRTAGKRWDRLVGAIQLEKVNGQDKQTPVFRTIKDVIDETEIVKPTPPEAEKTEEVEHEPEPVVEHKDEAQEIVVFRKGTKVEFIPDVANENLAVLNSDAQSYTMTSDEFVNMRDVQKKVYTANADITVKTIQSGFEEVFGKLDFVDDIPWPEKKEEQDLAEVVIPKDTQVTFKIVTEGDDKALSILNKDDKELAHIIDPGVEGVEEGIYDVTCDVTFGEIHTIDLVLEDFLGNFEKWLDPNEVLIVKDEVVELEGQTGRFKALKDITRAELQSPIEVKLTLFEVYSDPEEILFKVDQIVENDGMPKIKITKDVKRCMLLEDGRVPADCFEVIKEESKKEEKEMPDEIVYKSGEEFVINGEKYRALKDITVKMIREKDGVLDEYIEPVKTEIADVDGKGDQPASKAVGEIPVNKRCDEEHTKAEYLQMLFGTSNPSILHLFKTLRMENENNEQVKITGTWPTETLSVWDNYTFSILRKKNGAFYRVYVCHTDRARVADGKEGYLLTKQDERDRWFCIGDIQDREIGPILQRRHAC